MFLEVISIIRQLLNFPELDKEYVPTWKKRRQRILEIFSQFIYLFIYFYLFISQAM